MFKQEPAKPKVLTQREYIEALMAKKPLGLDKWDAETGLYVAYSMCNVLQTVAQMRKYQKEFFAAKDSETKKRCLIESKKLEQAVDMRLSEFGIREV